MIEQNTNKSQNNDDIHQEETAKVDAVKQVEKTDTINAEEKTSDTSDHAQNTESPQKQKTLWFNDKNKTKQINCVVSIPLLRESGCSYGDLSNKVNQKSKRFIFTKLKTKNRSIHIINFEKTASYLNLLYRFIQEQAKNNKTFLFVGTKPSAQYYIKTNAERCGEFYMNKRWVSGLFTNFSVVRKSITKYLNLVKQSKANQFSDLTKKEIVLKQREILKLEKLYGGVPNMQTLPDFIIIVDTNNNNSALKEAKTKKVPVIAIINTSASPTDADFFVPANNVNYKSIRLITTLLADAVCAGKGLPVLIANKQELTTFPIEGDEYHTEMLLKQEKYLENKKLRYNQNKNKYAEKAAE